MTEIRWGTGRARLAILQEDVFRLRICREEFARDNSWAVIGEHPPQESLPLNGAKFFARTPQGSLVLDESSTEWALRDGKGRDILRGPAVGFFQEHAFLRINLEERDQIFGLGETTGPMNKRGLVRDLWNIDVLGHSPAIHPQLKSLYVSIPFAILMRDGRATGIFWDNPARQVWDMGHTNPDQLTVSADHGEINVYFFSGPTIQSIVARYTELTGRTPLPPRWGLGYHQCRYSYESAERVVEIAANFRARQIPCDAIYLDIHHMDGYRVFTFGKKFPNPKAMTDQLAADGFKTVAIVDPGVKNDRKFGVFQRGLKKNAFVKSQNGHHNYVGKVWPGPSRFPDFMRKSVRDWWGREQAALHKVGVTGIWNDVNEPANFALPSKTLPPDCRHQTDFGPARHVEIHNAYGSEMARTSRAGAVAFDSTKRPFIITRAGYAGVQRHALVWTGDNSSLWEHLAESIPQLLNLSLSGVPFCGADIGGFLSHATGELLARWTQLACLTPFFRNHSNEGTRAQEPWAFGPEIEAVCRGAIQLRYQFLPYIYTLFERASRDGSPIIRPLIWHYQNDPQCVAVQDQFLLGENLLVAPVTQLGARARAVYLPPGQWHEFWTSETHRGRKYILADAPLHLLPLYVKAGAIIPFAPLVQHTGEYSTNDITVQIWPGADGKLEFYDDDGESMKSAEYRRTIEFIDRDRGGVVRFGAVEGKYNNGPKMWRIILHRVHPKSLPYHDGEDLPIHRDRHLKILAFEIKERRRAFEIAVA